MVCDVKSRIDRRSWVQITAGIFKFTWLAQHRKSKILGNNGDKLCFLWMGRLIINPTLLKWPRSFV